MKKIMCATVLMLVAATVFAQGDNFSKLDANNDGLISRDEANIDDTLTAIFNDLDVNFDGYLSKSELEVKTGN